MRISKFALAAATVSALATTPISPASAAHGRNTAAAVGAVGGFLLGSAIFGHQYYGYPRYYYGYPQYYYAPGPAYYYPPPGYYYGRPYDPAIAYCMRRFRSYDPYSMTYLGFDGRRHRCP
ncbi:MAG TPA: BA14K family protein [Xanthobacteraceae bacterium]|nr:BA14K family protein [Xanthobacteraceae bacterium]